jgi:hypothetical protein
MPVQMGLKGSKVKKVTVEKEVLQDHLAEPDLPEKQVKPVQLV